LQFLSGSVKSACAYTNVGTIAGPATYAGGTLREVSGAPGARPFLAWQPPSTAADMGQVAGDFWLLR
jgi:hypothetical protein